MVWPCIAVKITIIAVFKAEQWALLAPAVRTIPGWDAVQAETDVAAVTVISGGLTNLLYRLTWAPACCGAAAAEPPVAHESELLVRLYGALDGLIERAHEIELFAAVGEAGCAPRCHATFEGGRVEQWLAGRTLQPADAPKPAVMAQLGVQTARLHARCTASVRVGGLAAGSATPAPQFFELLET